MDRDLDGRLAVLVPEISGVTAELMRAVVGLEPPERVPTEAWRVSGRVLEKHGVEGLRLLLVCLTGWSAVQTERVAMLTGRSLEAVLDELDVARHEVLDDD
ncbi:hypothetical protein AB0I84_31280 [Streptomyces spectabilis]|uniref:hypothetical protein n=1 Tax=Streptomyces spectabilis TaxID=68270 RepID=UPI0033EF5908